MGDTEAITRDVELLRMKVNRIERILEELIEIYTDVFYEVKEYFKKIRKEGEFEKFSDINNLRKLIEEE